MTTNPLFKKRVPLILLVVTFLFTSHISAQTVSASDIMQDIKSGKSISYENVTITGVLDMTFMEEKLKTLPKKRKWYKKGSNSVEEQIENRISFKNCVFEDHVYAYFHEEDTEYTFVANFENDVSFTDCTFKGEALFKYSEFEGNSDFSGSKFGQRTTFKYAEFDTMVSFAGTGFKEDAVFKYTKFKNGVSFNNAVFEVDLNIKYMKVNGDFDIRNMTVSDDIDAKYTSINGESFSKHLLKNNN